MRVIVVDMVYPLLTEGLVNMGFELTEDYSSSREVIMNSIEDHSGLVIRSRFPIDKDFLMKATQLEFIARVGAGLENIDVDFAEQRGIHLINAPEGNSGAVAEHAIGMLLMLLNKLKKSDTEVRKGQWLREENRGYEIEGKCVGVIGYGYMGEAFVKRLQGFGAEILVYDKYLSGFGNNWIQEVSLETLMEKTDILSLHLPINEETRWMVNDDFINAFAKPFYLINTARGRIVETAALVRALQSGKIKGACLDVLEYEKSSFEDMFQQALPPEFEFLTQSDKVILSPHIAGWTHESNFKMAEVILEKLKKLYSNGI